MRTLGKILIVAILALVVAVGVLLVNRRSGHVEEPATIEVIEAAKPAQAPGAKVQTAALPTPAPAAVLEPAPLEEADAAQIAEDAAAVGMTTRDEEVQAGAVTPSPEAESN